MGPLPAGASAGLSSPGFSSGFLSPGFLSPLAFPVPAGASPGFSPSGLGLSSPFLSLVPAGASPGFSPSDFGLPSFLSLVPAGASAGLSSGLGLSSFLSLASAALSPSLPFAPLAIGPSPAPSHPWSRPCRIRMHSCAQKRAVHSKICGREIPWPSSTNASRISTPNHQTRNAHNGRSKAQNLKDEVQTPAWRQPLARTETQRVPGVQHPHTVPHRLPVLRILPRPPGAEYRRVLGCPQPKTISQRSRPAPRGGFFLF